MVLYMINPHTKEVKSNIEWIEYFTGTTNPSVEEFQKMCCGTYADLREVFKNKEGQWEEHK